MWPYLAVFGFIFLLALLPVKLQHSWVTWLFTAPLLVVFIGLRHKVGMDWSNYLGITEYNRHLTFWEVVLKHDFVYHLINWSSIRLGFEIYGGNLFVAAVFVAGLARFCRGTQNPYLALLWAYPMLVMAFSLSAVRQSLAIGVFLWGFSVWADRRLYSRLMIVALATLCHASAIFLLPLCFMQQQYHNRHILLALMIAVVSIPFYLASESWEYYSHSYLKESGNYVASGAFMHVSMAGLPAVLYMLSRNRLDPARAMPAYMTFMVWMGILMWIAALGSSPITSRLGMYLYPAGMAIVGMLPYIANRAINRVMILLSVAATSGAVMLGWLMIANSSHAHIPYRNILFEG